MILDDAHAEFVNLDKRPERRERMEAELARVGIKASRRRGMLPEEGHWDKARIKAMWERPQKGAIGCHFSQVAVIQEALLHKKHALVMEDDLEFCDDFPRRLELIDAFLRGREWDIMWLGGTFHINPPYWHINKKRGCQALGRDAVVVPGHPRFVRTFGCFCTYAYLVNRASILKVLSRMEERLPESIGIDHLMIMLQPSLHTFAFVPGSVKQYDHISDIGLGWTGFSNFAKLNGTVANSRYWFAERMEDFDPATFNWHEAAR
jgi:GR25 family glycosyltransferase involved in LPS biosynthesis